MNDIHGEIMASFPMMTAGMTMKKRANFTHYHQESAKINAAFAKQIEDENDSKDGIDESIKIKYISHISSSIISSVASLESKINEFIADNGKQINENIQDQDFGNFLNLEKIKQKKDIINKLNKSTSVVCKYKLLFALNMVPSIDEKTEECLNLLVDIRNSIIHFTPEWDNDLKKHKKIESRKKNHFSISPFYSSNSLFFPYRCLSANCAEWGIAVTNLFINKHLK